MPASEAWDARYRAGAHSSTDPDTFLTSSKPWFSTLADDPAALDLACGAGRNALWLAAQGFRTVAVDSSSEALSIVRERASEAALAIETSALDLESEDVDLGLERYALIACVQFLHRPLFPVIERALNPGGLLIFKTYTVDQLGFAGGPRNPSHLLERNELLRRFAAWRVLRYEERRDGAGTAALLAQKPEKKASAS